MKILSKTFAVSLCSAIMLGVVGVPGALAQSSTSPSNSSSSSTSSLRTSVATATSGLTYVVAMNDSLSAIASKAKVKFNDLLAVNGFKATSVILPGQVIKLPDSAVVNAASATSTPVAAAPSVASGSTYTVVKNDSLGGIALKAKVSLSSFLAVNGFKKTSVIVPGQIVKLPDSAVVNAASATSTPVAAAPSVASGSTYTVVKNDSLSGIALKAKVSLSSFLAVNGFKKTSVIVPGQIVKLPKGAVINAAPAMSTPVAAAPSVASGSTYTVVKNDSLSGIALKAKVSLSSFLAVNGFKKTSVIVPGQIVKLPEDAKVIAKLTPATDAPSAPYSRLQVVLDFAKAQIGKPYEFGKAGPTSYDCSGLTLKAFAQVKVSLPHQSFLQSRLGTAVDWKSSAIQAGDLVFTFSSMNMSQISHVGIAISSTQWIEAPYTGGVVRISSLPSASKIQAVRRVL
jgi:LysM repeat protein